LARNPDSWRDELLAYSDTEGLSSAPNETSNALIKEVKKNRHGYRNFDSYPCGCCCSAAWTGRLHDRYKSEAG
jgi:transposase